MVFYKFHGNGNDFIIIDNMDNKISLNTNIIRQICHRRFGVGADGLMLINPSDKYDFEMDYYNSDGYLGSMCGNGGRCIAAFARLIGLVVDKATFLAFDGVHNADIIEDQSNKNTWNVSLSMGNVTSVEKADGYYFLDTGSPHYVEFVEKIAQIDVYEQGKKTRNSELFSPGGTNVNFVEISKDRIFVRTYERGVEEETLSCGTGVTAAALASYLETGINNIKVHTTGGDFEVGFKHNVIDDKDVFSEICLHGPAQFIYKGEIEI